MIRKVLLSAALLLAVAPMALIAAPAFQYSYAVKFVCGYNPSNLGYDSTGGLAGEPVVKFGNYATDINIYNFNVLSSTAPPATIEKRVLLLVKSGFPIGREPAIVDVSAATTDRGITVSEWDIRIFECVAGARYELHHERIGEIALPLAEVRRLVADRFELLEEVDEDGLEAGDDSVKAYYALRRKD